MTLRRNKKLKEILEETFRELYSNATPSADFDLLCLGAKENENGQKVIDYDNYTLDKATFSEIVERNMKKVRMTPAEKSTFKFSVYLGPSPKIIYPEEDLNE